MSKIVVTMATLPIMISLIPESVPDIEKPNIVEAKENASSNEPALKNTQVKQTTTKVIPANPKRIGIRRHIFHGGTYRLRNRSISR